MRSGRGLLVHAKQQGFGIVSLESSKLEFGKNIRGEGLDGLLEPSLGPSPDYGSHANRTSLEDISDSVIAAFYPVASIAISVCVSLPHAASGRRIWTQPQSSADLGRERCPARLAFEDGGCQKLASTYPCQASILGHP